METQGFTLFTFSPSQIPTSDDGSGAFLGRAGEQLAVTPKFTSIFRGRRSRIAPLGDIHADPLSHEFGNIVGTAAQCREIEIYLWRLERIQRNLGERITAQLGIRGGIVK